MPPVQVEGVADGVGVASGPAAAGPSSAASGAEPQIAYPGYDAPYSGDPGVQLSQDAIKRDMMANATFRSHNANMKKAHELATARMTELQSTHSSPEAAKVAIAADPEFRDLEAAFKRAHALTAHAKEAAFAKASARLLLRVDTCNGYQWHTAQPVLNCEKVSPRRGHVTQAHRFTSQSTSCFNAHAKPHAFCVLACACVCLRVPACLRSRSRAPRWESTSTSPSPPCGTRAMRQGALPGCPLSLTSRSPSSAC